MALSEDISSQNDIASSNASAVLEVKARANDLDSSSIKRKSNRDSLLLNENHKRPRLLATDNNTDSNCTKNRHQAINSHLPAEIWHRILTYVPPQTLGRVMLVNKLFYSYLDASSEITLDGRPCSSASHVLLRLKPDSIWQASRRIFWPFMPAPMKGRSELDMWRLCCSRACQFCASHDQAKIYIQKQKWKQGLGETSVSPVFPFFAASCGKCLRKNCVKESELLLKPSSVSALLPGLPVVHITSKNHVVPAHMLDREPEQVHMQITRVLWADQIDKLRTAIESIKAFGTAAADSCMKYFENHGKSLIEDASHWEKWQLSGGVEQMRFSMFKATAQNQNTLRPKDGDKAADLFRTDQIVTDPTRSTLVDTETLAADVGTEGRCLSNSVPEARMASGWPSLQTRGNQGQIGETKTGRKSQKRAEIERRAFLLHPPILPNVLGNLPAFQAALRATTPLDDAAWKDLRRQLVTERNKADGARFKSKKYAQTLVAVNLSDSLNGHCKSAKVEWDGVQRKLRGVISAFADEIIKDKWKSGHMVNKENAPQFAADVLLRVRRRFYQQFSNQAAGHEAAAEREASIEPFDGPWTTRLTMDTMKWTYNTKVRLYTDSFGKDIFLCSACQRAKGFVFDGLVQHYATKHTKILSIRKKFINWAAEWPESPLFDPEPGTRVRSLSTKKLKRAQKRCQAKAELPWASKSGSQGHCLCPASQDRTSSFAHRAATDISAYCSSTRASYVHPEPRVVDPTLPYFSGKCDSSYTYSPRYMDQPTNARFYAGFYENTTSLQHTDYGQHDGTQNTPCHNEAEQETLMAKTAMETWHRLTDSKDLPDSIRMCAVIRHVVRRHEQTYNTVAPLRMFKKTVFNHEDTILLRNVTGLRCESCKSEPDSQLRDKHFSLKCLLKHFMKQHKKDEIAVVNEPLDWSVSMIRLPQMSVLSKLKDMVHRHTHAFEIVSEMFPWAFGLQIPTHRASGKMPEYTDLVLHQGSRPERLSLRYDGRPDFRPAFAPHIKANDFAFTGTSCPSQITELSSHSIYNEFTHQPRTEILPRQVMAKGDTFHMQEYPRQPLSFPGKSGYQDHCESNNSFRQVIDSGSPHHASSRPDRCPEVPSMNETYDFVEVRDTHDGNYIKRPLHHGSSYRNHQPIQGQPVTCTVPGRLDRYAGGGVVAHSHSGRLISDYQEHSPSFPTASAGHVP